MLNSFRPKRAFPDRDDKAQEPQRCSYKGCEKSTRFRKDRCIDHLHETPYVMRLAAELARRGAEIRKLDEPDPILPADAHLVSEVAAILWEKRTITAPGLTRFLEITSDQAERLFRSLSEHGIAEIYRNRRGVVAVRDRRPQEIE